MERIPRVLALAEDLDELLTLQRICVERGWRPFAAGREDAALLAEALKPDVVLVFRGMEEAERAVRMGHSSWPVAILRVGAESDEEIAEKIDALVRPRKGSATWRIPALV